MERFYQLQTGLSFSGILLEAGCGDLNRYPGFNSLQQLKGGLIIGRQSQQLLAGLQRFSELSQVAAHLGLAGQGGGIPRIKNASKTEQAQSSCFVAL